MSMYKVTEWTFSTCDLLNVDKSRKVMETWQFVSGKQHELLIDSALITVKSLPLFLSVTKWN